MKYLPLEGARQLRGYFTWSKTSLPVPRKPAVGGGPDVRFCRNCDTPLTADFCPECGQLDRDLNRPIWTLMVDSADALFDIDSRIFRTIMPLILLPGHLTKSYNEGKRARYLPPVRLYIMASILFFLTVSIADIAILKIEFFPRESTEGLTIEDLDPEQVTPFDEASSGPSSEDESEGGDESQDVLGDSADDVALSNSRNGDVIIGDFGFDLEIKMFAPADPSENSVPLPPDAFQEAIEGLAANRDEALKTVDREGAGMELATLEFAEDVLRGFQVAVQDPRALNKEINIWLPRAMIFMLPIFALLLRLFYWGRKQYLMDMLVFSLHFHSYIFLVITFFIAAQILIGSAASAWMFALAVPVYLFVALKVTSGQGIIRTFFKFIFLSFIYSILLNVAMLGILLVGLSEI